MADRRSRSRPSGSADLRWLNLLKAVAISWIFLNHLAEQLFGGPYFGNPYKGWPPLAERVAQLAPLHQLGEWLVPANLLRYVGWCGDQGVQLFLIASGFGLTWGLLSRGTGDTLPLADFYRRRGKRVFPLWWTAHLFFFLTWLVTGWGMSLAKPATYLSFLGLRITLKSFYYFAPAWWFIGLLLQLYLVYPLLWKVLKRKGPVWLFAVGSSVSLMVRGIGLLVLEQHLDFWSRGGFFMTRLPEFLFGVCLAAWTFENPGKVDRLLKRPRTVLGAIAIYLIGICLSFLLLGMAVAPLLVGVGAFLVLYPPLAWLGARGGLGIGDWIGRHSYSLFLMHHPFILLVVSPGYGGVATVVLRSTALAVALAVITALFLERVASSGFLFLQSARSRGRLAWVGLGCLILALTGGSALIWAEMLVRERAPQEVYGWGERPSLEPHEAFGWRLRPATRTRLRWETYDYEVEANSLGFPGKEYPAQKPAGTKRILTIGDAFTSAEGVDTEKAWPRLLEEQLARGTDRDPVEVLNFAVTGYGPEQYAAVLERYVPEYFPDVIIIGFFVNEYLDVFVSKEEFRQDIGFGRPLPEDMCTVFDRPHWTQFLRRRLFEPIFGTLTGTPSDHGYFLSGLTALEASLVWPRIWDREKVAGWLTQIDATAREIDAEVLLLLIPAPIQVCTVDQLRYLPRGYDPASSYHFDFDRPQRISRELARDLGFEVLDLRPVLSLDNTDGECVYQPRNLHWTEEGHRRVAAYVAEYLTKEGL